MIVNNNKNQECVDSTLFGEFKFELASGQWLDLFAYPYLDSQKTTKFDVCRGEIKWLDGRRYTGKFKHGLQNG